MRQIGYPLMKAPERCALYQGNMFLRFCQAYPRYDREARAVSDPRGSDTNAAAKRSRIRRLKRKLARLSRA
jgi:hypothetical protein